jgi:F0F1-type ATP synthase membrane subunit b/b'
MAQAADEIRQQLHKSFEELKTLRDDIRVRVHLASMEAKKQWNENLEPRFSEAEKHVRDAGASARETLAEIVKSFKTFSATLAHKVEDVAHGHKKS